MKSALTVSTVTTQKVPDIDIRSVLDGPGGRRELLAAFFTRLDVQVTDREASIGVERTELNAGLHDWRAQHRLSATAHTPPKKRESPEFLRKTLFRT